MMTRAANSTTIGHAEQSAETPPSTGQERLYRNVLWSWAAYAVFVAAGFFMPRLIDRHLGQAMLGVWDLGWSVVAYLSLTPLGVGSAVIRYVSRHRAQGDRMALARTASSAFGIQLVAATLSVLITIAFALLLSRDGEPSFRERAFEIRWVILLLGLSVAIQIACDVFRGVITACHRWDIHNGLNAGSYLLTVLAMALTLTLDGDLVDLALATLAVTVSAELLRVVIAYRICPMLSVDLRLADAGTVRQLLRFGLKSVVIEIAGLVLYQGMNVLVARYLGAAALAAFARPLALVRHVTVLVNKYAYVLTPTASSLQVAGGPEGLSGLVLQTARVAAYLTFPMVLGLSILGDAVLEVWMGPSYRLGPVLAVLAIGHLLPIVQEPLVSILTGTNRHGRVAIALAVAAGVGAVVGFLTLTYTTWGLLGAALAITVPLTLMKGLYLPFSACRHLGIPAGAYARAALVIPVLQLMPLILVLAACRFALHDHPALALASAAILGTLAVYPVYWYSLLTPSARDRLRARLGKQPTRPASHDNVRPTRLLWKVVLDACWLLGPLRLWRWLHRHEVTIVTIHGVMDRHTPAAWAPLRPQLSPATLERSLRILTRHYRVVSLQAAVDMLAGRTPLQTYSLALTFDDGYRNNVTHALPVLRSFAVPATFFVATGHVEDRRPFWFDRLDYALQHAAVDGRTILIGNIPISFRASDRSSLRSAYGALRAAAKSSSRPDHETINELETIAGRLEEECGCRLSDIFESDPWSGVATWDDLRAASASDLEHGSHTVDHVRLALANPDTVRKQLAHSKRAIESHLGQPCRYLCYPSGSYDHTAMQIAQDCGYEAALTSVDGTNRRGESLFSLRRRALPDASSTAELIGHLSGFTAFFGRPIRTLRSCGIPRVYPTRLWMPRAGRT
jgi:O-antigen/teichoic acid export membrane protein/peptidoglycan/xylan/chitin deacetylase (PgdA/CDA1 family)